MIAKTNHGGVETAINQQQHPEATEIEEEQHFGCSRV